MSTHFYTVFVRLYGTVRLHVRKRNRYECFILVTNWHFSESRVLNDLNQYARYAIQYARYTLDAVFAFFGCKLLEG
jgi:hypothetical protein